MLLTLSTKQLFAIATKPLPYLCVHDRIIAGCRWGLQAA
jgi:hypothetical protein